MTDQGTFDVIVVGAGIVGSAAVLALSALPLRIALLEVCPPSMDEARDSSSRPISLAYGSVQILKTLQVWDALSTLASPIQSVHVSSAHQFGHVGFDAKQAQLPALGFVVPFSALQRILFQRVLECPTVQFIKIEKLQAVQAQEGGCRVQVLSLGMERHLEARLLIGADGVDSTVRRLLQLPATQRGLQQVAVTGRFKTRSPHQKIAYERFHEQGVLALLPLKNTRHYAWVWTMTTQAWQAQKTNAPSQWCAAIERIMANRLQGVSDLEISAPHPLQTVTMQSAYCPGAVLLGNAARSFAPIAAQGFNLALRDAAVLAEIMAEDLQKNRPLGRTAALQRYEQRRAQDQRTIACWSQNLGPLFHSALPGLACLRGLGLLALDALPLFHRVFLNRALGLAPPVCALARGVQLGEAGGAANV